MAAPFEPPRGSIVGRADVAAWGALLGAFVTA